MSLCTTVIHNAAKNSPIIFLLILQTVIIVQMMSTGWEGVCVCVCMFVCDIGVLWLKVLIDWAGFWFYHTEQLLCARWQSRSAHRNGDLSERCDFGLRRLESFHLAVTYLQTGLLFSHYWPSQQLLSLCSVLSLSAWVMLWLGLLDTYSVKLGSPLLLLWLEVSLWFR